MNPRSAVIATAPVTLARNCRGGAVALRHPVVAGLAEHLEVLGAAPGPTRPPAEIQVVFRPGVAEELSSRW